MSKKSGRGSSLRFTVAIEFLFGLVGIYGIGRLLTRRVKEARILLGVSLVLLLCLDLLPRLVLHNEYALWLPWVVKLVLATISAVQLNFALDRAQRRSRG